MKECGATRRRVRLQRILGPGLAAVLVATMLTSVASPAQAAVPEGPATNGGAATGGVVNAAGRSTVDAELAADGVAQPALSEVIAPTWDVRFDRVLTAGIWNASTRGRPALRAYCLTFAGPALPLLAYCLAIVESASVFSQVRNLGPPNGRCLRLAPRFGIPPYQASYISCSQV